MPVARPPTDRAGVSRAFAHQDAEAAAEIPSARPRSTAAPARAVDVTEAWLQRARGRMAGRAVREPVRRRSVRRALPGLVAARHQRGPPLVRRASRRFHGPIAAALDDLDARTLGSIAPRGGGADPC